MAEIRRLSRLEFGQLVTKPSRIGTDATEAARLEGYRLGLAKARDLCLQLAQAHMGARTCANELEALLDDS